MIFSLYIVTFSYLLGSVPFGYILVRIFYGQDVRESGSGNIGATNVARSSPVLGFFTLLLDAGKGFCTVVYVLLIIDNANPVFGGPHPHRSVYAAMSALVVEFPCRAAGPHRRPPPPAAHAAQVIRFPTLSDSLTRLDVDALVAATSGLNGAWHCETARDGWHERSKA